MNDRFMQWDLRKEQLRAGQNADESEWQAIRFGTSPIDEGIRDNTLGGELTELEQQEEMASAIADEIDRRIDLLGKAYPFVKNDNAIEYVPSHTHVYEFCLSISFLESIRTSFGKRYQIAFERLVRDVMRCYLGRGASAYRTGVPGDELEDRPTLIDGMVKQIGGMLASGEWKWSPDGDHPYGPTRTDVGDLGVDIVAWKQMPDKRRGNVFFLGQCACGHTNWDAKFQEPNQGRLQGWISPLSFVPIVRVFAVPFHIPNVIHFGDVNREAGLTFDRARLVMLSEANEHRSEIMRSAKEPYSTLLKHARSEPGRSGGKRVVASTGGSRRRQSRG